jgi:hypothetical protein
MKNVFHIDHVVHKKVRLLSPLKRMTEIQHLNNIFSKYLMKFHDNVPYFYVILILHIMLEMRNPILLLLQFFYSA